MQTRASYFISYFTLFKGTDVSYYTHFALSTHNFTHRQKMANSFEHEDGRAELQVQLEVLFLVVFSYSHLPVQ